ncbi:MAG: hypothetical protein JO324_02450 [Candidatus Eremiobacteraeota bacterium]|nr:hypothetical protein [Candidatus Eremiobacteraeota bacterium]
MRDVATLVWVVLIIVGVVSSMISSVRRQVRAMPRRPRSRSLPLRMAGPQPATIQAAPSVPIRPRPAPPPAQTAVALHVPEAARSRKLFGSKRDVVRAVISAEVFGKPRALRGEDLTV